MESNYRLVVGPVPKIGRGLFAAEHIPCGVDVFRVQMLVFSDADYYAVDGTVISDYAFNWDATRSALMLGIGSFMNFSFTPNVVVVRHCSEGYCVVRSIEEIPKGHEIRFSYGPRNGPGCHEPVEWFDASREVC